MKPLKSLPVSPKGLYGQDRFLYIAWIRRCWNVTLTKPSSWASKGNKLSQSRTSAQHPGHLCPRAAGYCQLWAGQQ